MTAPAQPVPDLDLAEVLEPGLWAVYDPSWIGMRRERSPSCPITGWMHEGHAPYRVIVSRDPFRLPAFGERRPYTGDEPTLDVDAWIASSI
jgi:hypothetical protein